MFKVSFIILNLLFLSQTLQAFTNENRRMKIVNRNRLQKRELITLLSKPVYANYAGHHVNPLDVIPIPLKMDVPNSQNIFSNNEATAPQQIEQVMPATEPTKPTEFFDAKLSDLKQMYENAITNLRTETVGSQTYLQKKSNQAEKEIGKILRNVELILNNRIELSFHSIQTKMVEAQNALNFLSNKILTNMDVKMKALESELIDQINKEKLDLDQKINSFNQKINILNEKLMSVMNKNSSSTDSAFTETAAPNLTTATLTQTPVTSETPVVEPQSTTNDPEIKQTVSSLEEEKKLAWKINEDDDTVEFSEDEDESDKK